MLYGLLVLACLLGCLVGLFSHSSSKRESAKKGGIAALVLLGAALVIAGFAADDRAKKAGWKSESDLQAAKKAGITDPKIYAQHKAKFEADAKAKADADAAAENAKADAMQLPKQRQIWKRGKNPRGKMLFMLNRLTRWRSSRLYQSQSRSTRMCKMIWRRAEYVEIETRAICGAVKVGKAIDWTGTLTELTTNGDGLGVVTIAIADDVSVQTMNNAFSDISSNTLIDPDSAVFRKLSTLKKGERVKFSGTFVTPPTNVDCLWEISITMDGAMDEPSFVMRFSDVQTY